MLSIKVHDVRSKIIFEIKTHSYDLKDLSIKLKTKNVDWYKCFPSHWIQHTHIFDSHTHTCTSCPCVCRLTPSGRCVGEWRSRSYGRWWPQFGTWPWPGSPRWGWWRSACCGPHCPSSGCGPYRRLTPAWLSFRQTRRQTGEEKKGKQIGEP